MAEISFRGVQHSYGDRQVLRGIDLTLTEGRIGILGANGSGKSTLARLINGLVLPSTGTVTVDGLDVAAKGKEVRRRVGFIFTDPDNQIVMPTVAEDVAFTLRRSGLNKQQISDKVGAILSRFGLQDHHDHPAHLLSGGQKQLLALASVLVAEPAILVADEPTTLLDLRNTRMIGQLLGALDQQVVVVTHDLDLITGFDRVVVIDDGLVAADGPPADSIERYRTLIG